MPWLPGGVDSGSPSLVAPGGPAWCAMILFCFNRINPTPSLTWGPVWNVHSRMQTVDLKSGPAGG